MANKKGLDLCYHQGDVNWPQVKAAGIDFIIPRDGWGPASEKNGKALYADPKFFQNVKEAQEAGIEVQGIYHFIYGINEAEARENAACAINNLRKAGLPKETVIWCDLEYDTVDNARDYRGVNLTNAQLKAMATAFCNYCLEQGYPTGIYLNQDYATRVYGLDILDKFDIWLADLEAEPAYKCVVRQVGWYAQIAGIPTKVDTDEFYGQYGPGTAKPKSNKEGENEITMGKIEKFLQALKTKGDGRYVYYNGSANSRGCSAYIEECLRDAGVIKTGETFHAGSGNRGVLTDTDRFEHFKFNANILQAGDIMWNQGHHVSAWAGDPRKSTYEAAPEKTHSLAEGGTGVGLHVGHGTDNCGGGSGWTDIYRIIEDSKEDKAMGKPKASEYVKECFACLERDTTYNNTYPYNVGVYDGKTLFNDCWNFVKCVVHGLYLNSPLSKHYTVGEEAAKKRYSDGIRVSGLGDVGGDYIMANYCEKTTFGKMLASTKPALLLINGQHMGSYLGEYTYNGKTYNVCEQTNNKKLKGGLSRSYVDEYGRRMTCKNGEVIGTWNQCGYLTAFLDYSDWEEKPQPDPQPTPQPIPEPTPEEISDLTLALQIYRGEWGRNPGRETSITMKYGAGKYRAAQDIVNHIVSAMNWYRIEINLAKEILEGKWDRNPTRQERITLSYGANAYRIAQSYVNSICAEEYTLKDLQNAYDVAEGILGGVYGNDPERTQKIVSQYGTAVRNLAQKFVNEVLK